MRIRLAREGDLAGIMALEKEVFGLGSFSEEMVESFLSDPEVRTLMVGVGAVVAYSMVRLSTGYETAEVLSLAVSPSYRHRGLGREMVAEMERMALEGGFLTVMLCVRPDNAAAVNLYHSQGYRLLARLKGYYEDGADADLLVKHMEG